jgi:predicted anti-sigma-YlaC factor YlaD
LFKVSKATAAALLPPDDKQQAEVLARMARLQPLKWRHFALRQQHMAQQIKEAAMAAAKQAQAAGSSGSSGKKPTLLVIVGRQHCAALHALWSDPVSSLWRTQMPRTFAPSVVEPQAEATPGAATGPAKQPPADSGRAL